MKTKIKIVPDAKYSITEAAKELGMTRQTILRYCGWALKFGTAPNGRKYFWGKDIIKFWNTTI